MKKIIHLSDLHVGYPGLAERFASMAQEIAFLKEPADDYVIVITGDLVDRASQENYETVGAVIDHLAGKGFRVLVVPGNHDYGTGTFGEKRWVGKFKQHFFPASDATYPKLDLVTDESPSGKLDTVAFIGLDSMAEELHWYDALGANGELGREQLGRLETMLSTSEVSGCSKKVVYPHHHPFDPRFMHELKDASELKRVIAGKVDCLLYGHNHQGKVRNGKWGIPRCYDGGSSTHKNDSPGFERVIDLARDPRDDYDGHFI